MQPPYEVDASLRQWNPPLYRKFMKEKMTPAQYKKWKEFL